MNTPLPKFIFENCKPWIAIANSEKTICINTPEKYNLEKRGENPAEYMFVYRGDTYQISYIHMEYDKVRDELIFKTTEYNREILINSENLESRSGYDVSKFIYCSTLSVAGKINFIKKFYPQINNWFKANKEIILKGFEIEKIQKFLDKIESLENKKRELEMEIAKIESELEKLELSE